MDMSHAVLLVVDVNHKHFDLELNYLPVDGGDAKRILDTLSSTVVPAFRERDLPVAFVTTVHQINPLTGESMSVANPHWRYQMEHKEVTGVGRKRVPINAVNSKAGDIMPQLEVKPHDVVVYKQRYSPFLGTHLEMFFRIMKVETVFIVGANTNNCILCTAFEARNRDFRVILIEDCCASMNGPEYHELGLKQVRASIGFTIKSGELAGVLDGNLEPWK